jgi:hypothetical protein
MAGAVVGADVGCKVGTAVCVGETVFVGGNVALGKGVSWANAAGSVALESSELFVVSL